MGLFGMLYTVISRLLTLIISFIRRFTLLFVFVALVLTSVLGIICVISFFTYKNPVVSFQFFLDAFHSIFGNGAA